MDSSQWNMLSDSLKQAFGWAHAVEFGDDVGTRSVLIGIMRASHGESEPEQLLRFTGVSADDLFAALQDVSPTWRINPYAPMWKKDERPLVVTPNVERALLLADAARPAGERGKELEARHVFGALLELPGSTAYRGLAQALGQTVSMPAFAASYRDYLNDASGLPFESFLERLQQAGEDLEPNDQERSEHADETQPPADRVEWLADAYAQEDLLGREHLASALAKRLIRMSESSPNESFLLHLDGPWGVGKSSVLHFLRQLLGTSWLIVDFDAWRQSRVGPPWWALLTSLRRELRRSLGPRAGAWLRVREIATRVRRDHGAAPFALLAVIGGIVYLLARPSPGAVRATLAFVTAAVGTAAVLLGPGRGLVAFLMWDSAMGARRYEQWHRDPMEGLAEHFAWLIACAPQPVIFFVDDLDRCDECYVVDLLDSIQTLVRHNAGRDSCKRAPCFVVAADGRWIRQSYEHTHAGFEEAVGEPGRPLGYLFLDKIFQLSVDVPAIGAEQQTDYLRRLLGRDELASASGSDTGALDLVEQSVSQRDIIDAVNGASPIERTHAAAAAVEKLCEPAVERATEHELEKFASLLARNPRSMKRFVNAYSMALSTLLLEGREVDPDALALWTVLRLRWPMLANYLRTDPNLVDRLVVDPSSASAMSEDLAALVTSTEVQNVLRFANGLLTSQAVGRLTGSVGFGSDGGLPSVVG